MTYICGVKLDFGISMPEVLRRVDEVLKQQDFGSYICTTNSEFIVTAIKDHVFRAIINDSMLSLPDGIGTIYAQKYIQGIKAFEKSPFFKIYGFLYGCWLGMSLVFDADANRCQITGVELTHRLCEYASKHDKTVFLLGGRSTDYLGKVDTGAGDLSLKTMKVLTEMYPGLKVVGATSQFSHDMSDDTATREFIHGELDRAGLESLDILFVAYGHPFQEKWIKRNSNSAKVRLSLGVGGTFDYISMQKRSTPRFIHRVHLGWLFRLLTQPWRYRRIIAAFPLFPLLIFYNYCLSPHKLS